MKVQVTLKAPSKSGLADNTIQVLVGLNDTVGDLKERIASIEPVPFLAEAELILPSSSSAVALGDDQRLAGLGLKENDSLSLISRGSALVFIEQLSMLLQAHPLSCLELGLLYCHKHGVTAKQALQAVAFDGELSEFVSEQKAFKVVGGCISCTAKIEPPAKQDVQVQPSSLAPIREEHFSGLNIAISVKVEVPTTTGDTTTVSLEVDSDDTVQNVKDRVAEEEMITFSDQSLLLDGVELEATQRLSECNVVDGTSLQFIVRVSEISFVQQLVALLEERALSINELSSVYCCRYGASVQRTLDLFGRGERFRDFLMGHPRFAVQSGVVALATQGPSDLKVAVPSTENRRYLEQHRTICQPQEAQVLEQALDYVVDTLASAQDLEDDILQLVKAGSVATGTAIVGCVTACIICITVGDPSRTASRLKELELPNIVCEELADPGMLLMRVDGLASVNVHLMAAVGSYAKVLKSTEPPHSAAPFAEMKVRYMERLPEAVKTTARLLKWWRAQQSWSSSKTSPSDDFLELLAAYAATQGRYMDQHQAVAAALGLVADGGASLRAVWPASARKYGDTHVPEKLLQQTPLFLDPVNPFMNLVDPDMFDISEMVGFASDASFFA